MKAKLPKHDDPLQRIVDAIEVLALAVLGAGLLIAGAASPQGSPLGVLCIPGFILAALLIWAVFAQTDKTPAPKSLDPAKEAENRPENG